MVKRIQHSKTLAQDSPDNRLHPQLGFPNVANAAARTAISQSALDRGRQIIQDDDDSVYMADGAGGWIQIAPTAVSIAATNGFRLTPQTAVPVPVGNLTGLAEIYWTPYKSDQVALYDGAAWHVRQTGQIDIDISLGTVLRPADLFVFWDGANVVVAHIDWASATTRATAIVRQDGVQVAAGDGTRRYIGTYLPRDDGGGATELDWITDLDLSGATTGLRLDIWNADNRVRIGFSMPDTGSNFTYGLAGWRQWRGDPDAQVEIIVGLQEEVIRLHAYATGAQAGAGPSTIGFGFDSVVAPDTFSLATFQNSTSRLAIVAGLAKQPVIGSHTLAFLQQNVGANTITMFTEISVGSIKAGFHGTWGC